jgi:hypothetical protein
MLSPLAPRRLRRAGSGRRGSPEYDRHGEEGRKEVHNERDARAKDQAHLRYPVDIIGAQKKRS